MIPSVGLADLFRQFLRIGLLSFGGPAAQIALMHRVLVDERGWLNERQFLNALSFCMLLPGPEAMQLATYAGWRLRGIAGGFVAGLLFVIPGALVIFVLATLYVLFADLPLVDTLFLGVQAAAVVIVVEALARISRRALHGTAQRIIAGLGTVRNSV
ncbi:MAG: chromate transporter, partial [Geminicoccaceae bacterium]|nr:chromate transporter [Geminicoccaceae bacterium]